MNRTIVVLVVALGLFSLVFLLTDRNKPEVDIKEELEQEVLVSVYRVESEIKKKDLINKNLLSVTKISQNDLELQNYVEVSNSNLSDKSIFRTGVKPCSLLTKDMLSLPGDNDYIDLILQENEIPYLYDDISSFTVKSLNLNTGDKISFVSTTSSKSNVLLSGYNEIDRLVSRVIIKNSRIIQVLEEKKEDSDEYNTSIVVALSPKNLLSLEMARKIGDISIIPSALNDSYMSIRSSHFLEDQFGVRELRGGRENENNH